jgi:hypothetical protein
MSNSSGTPPPERFKAQEALDVSRAPGAPEGSDPQVSASGVASNDGALIAKTVPEVDTTTTAGVVASSTMGEAATSSLAAMTGATTRAPTTPGDDNNVDKEPKVVMGHPGLGASGRVSVPEAMDTALFALDQVRDVLQRERRGLDEEQQCLIEWASLLKKQSASEKEKVAEKRERLDKMEVVFKEEVTIGLLDAQARELMEKAKELYAAAEARANANIKMQEDHNGQAIGLAQLERMVAGWELEVREKEEEVTDMLERGCNELSSCEADLNTYETALEADRKSLGDLRVEVLACQHVIELKANHLAFREKELANMEKRLAERQPQELATTHKKLEEI